MIERPALSRRSTLAAIGSMPTSVLAISAAAEPPLEPGHLLDVRAAYGAVGDGVHDDTIALQRAIDDVSLGRRGGILFFPAGTYRITKTVKFPVGAGGGVMSGTGCYPGDPRTKKRRGPHTVIMWDGESGGTMLSAEGNLGWKISNISFVGAASKGDRRAGVIYHCKYNKAFGSGGGLFESCWFVDAEIAIKMGDRSSDFGCADYVFVLVCFMFCGTGLYVADKQGVNYNFLYLGANWCDSVIVAEEGGHFYIQNAQIVGSGDPAKGAWAFDFRNLNDNASIVSINGLRVEQRTRPVLRASGVGRVAIIAYEEAQGDQATTMFEFAGVSANIEHSRMVTRSQTKPHINLTKGAQPSRFFGRDVVFDAETWEISEWLAYVSNSSAALERCFFSNRGKSIPAWTNDPLIGPVVLSGRSTGKGEIELTILGNSELEVSSVGARILTINTIVTDLRSDEVGSFRDEYILSGTSVVKLTSDAPSTVQRWGSLAVRFSGDQSRIRLFAHVNAACNWRSLVEVKGT